MISWERDPALNSEGRQTEVVRLGAMVVARHLLSPGFDAAAEYRGFPDRACQAEHWCYLARGKLRFRFAGGDLLVVDAGDAFHLRPGHLFEVLEPAELIELTAAGDYDRTRAHLAHATVHKAPDLPFAAPQAGPGPSLDPVPPDSPNAA